MESFIGFRGIFFLLQVSKNKLKAIKKGMAGTSNTSDSSEQKRNLSLEKCSQSATNDKNSYVERIESERDMFCLFFRSVQSTRLNHFNKCH